MPATHELIFDPGFESVEHGILTKWRVGEGEPFCTDDVIAVIETYKASVEFAAPFGGRMIKHCCRENEAISIPGVIAIVAPARGAQVPRAPAAPRASQPPPKLSPAAKKILRQQRIAIRDFTPLAQKAFYREKDVLQWLESRSAAVSTTGFNAPPVGISDLFMRLKDDQRELEYFCALSAETKTGLLKALGADIGDGVVMERGALAIGCRLRIGAGSVFKAGTVILGREVSIGENCFFESASKWSCSKIRIGDLFFCAAESRVGWGGEWGAGAYLQIGCHSFMGEQAMLNPGSGIEIGDEVAIGAGTKIYTHQFWQSVLEGYSAAHRPVRLKDNIHVGANVVILAGSVIESGVTVAANSLVNGPVAANRLVAGVPARHQQEGMYPKKLSTAERKKVVEGLMEEFCRQHGLRLSLNKKGWFANTRLGRIAGYASAEEPCAVLVTFKAPTKNEAPGAVVMNLQARSVTGRQNDLSDVLREFFRKRGIRFVNDSWRYCFKEIGL